MNGSEKGRLLVVDDLETSRYVISTWLRRAGYVVVEARTGAEALQIINSDPFDLAVLDVNLPDISGYDICQYIKSKSELSAMPVLHVSASATDTADRSEGLRRGAEGYLCEPVEREELLATVETLMRAATAYQTSLRLAERLRGLHDATIEINEVQNVDTQLETIACESSKLFETNTLVLVAMDGSAFAAVCGKDRQAKRYRLNATASGLIQALPTSGYIDGSDLQKILPQGVVADERYSVTDIGRHINHVGRILISTGALADEDQLVVLAQFARVAGLGLHNSRTHDLERHIAVTLQRGLLPEVISLVKEFDIAVRYEASAVHAEVGGDFYDAFEGPDGRIFIAIGDVAGHSIEAATIMAQLRTAFRSYAMENHDPVAILDRLNALLMRFHEGVTATVCCGVLDPKSGDCSLANAGHVPPLHVREETATVIWGSGTLLGLPSKGVTLTTCSLLPGDRLVFYTDGLVERRGESIVDGVERLARFVEQDRCAMDVLCERAFRALVPGNVTDDVAMMAIQRLPLEV